MSLDWIIDEVQWQFGIFPRDTLYQLSVSSNRFYHTERIVWESFIFIYKINNNAEKSFK